MIYQFPTIYKVACHTDNVGQGTIFVALPGTKTHGVQFIQAAIEKGATHIVVPCDAVLPADLVALMIERSITVEYADHIRERFAELAAQAYGNPAKKLQCIGITGTKGKTTTSFIMRSILEEAGFKTALLGTVCNMLGDQVLPQMLTTPHADYLHAFLNECVAQGVTHVVMEVSAQALTLARVHGILFAGVMFTNFSQEHAEFYATQGEYFAAKCSLFAQIADQAPIILNMDDPKLGQLLRDRTQRTMISVGKAANADYCIKILESSMQNGLVLTINEHLVRCKALVGVFNAYNIGMSFALSEQLGVTVQVQQQALEAFAGVKGRMQTYALPNGGQCIIDHAHTPSSFEAVLSTLRTHTQDLIAVFGIGGNRDTIKRPILGALAAQWADTVILTTDNPRNEEPENIIEDIKRGILPEHMHKVHVVLDREAAIKFAYSISQKGSIIALLAKGSDEYQEIKGVKYPFVERDIVAKL